MHYGGPMNIYVGTAPWKTRTYDADSLPILGDGPLPRAVLQLWQDFEQDASRK